MFIRREGKNAWEGIRRAAFLRYNADLIYLSLGSSKDSGISEDFITARVLWDNFKFKTQMYLTRAYQEFTLFWS